MADPRWGLFGQHDVVVTRYDDIIPRDVHQKIDFQIYYIPSKMYCHWCNILEVTEGYRISPPPPLSEKVQSIPLWIGLSKSEFVVELTLAPHSTQLHMKGCYTFCARMMKGLSLTFYKRSSTSWTRTQFKPNIIMSSPSDLQFPFQKDPWLRKDPYNSMCKNLSFVPEFNLTVWSKQVNRSLVRISMSDAWF